MLIASIVYFCIGILLSCVICHIVIHDDKEHDKFSLIWTMIFNVIFWPFIFYSIYNEIK